MLKKFGFLRHLRLVEQEPIRETCRKGKKVTAAGLTVFFKANQLDYPRLCVSINRKQVGKACQRHMIKRIARESFRLRQHELLARDIVIVVFKSLKLMNKAQIRQIIEAQWAKVK